MAPLPPPRTNHLAAAPSPATDNAARSTEGSAMLSRDLQVKLREAFRKADSNSDGVLDVREVAAFLRSQAPGRTVTEAELLEAFNYGTEDVPAGHTMEFAEFNTLMKAVLVEQAMFNEKSVKQSEAHHREKHSAPVPASAAEAGGAGWFALDGRPMRPYSMRTPTKLLVTSWTGTLFPVVLRRPEVWFFLIVHTTLFTIARQFPDVTWGEDEDKQPVPLSLALSSLIDPDAERALNIFTIFLLTGFTANVYERYRTLYYLARDIERDVYMVTSLCCMHIEEEAARFHVCRLALASAIITFMREMPEPGKDTASPHITEIQWERMLYSERAWLEKQTPCRAQEVYSSGWQRGQPVPPATMRFVVSGMAVHINKLTYKQTKAVLSEEERTILEMFPAKNMPLLLHTWMLRAARSGLFNPVANDRASTRSDAAQEALYTEVQIPVNSLYHACCRITHELSLPVPFPYYHAVVLLMTINYAAATLSFLEANTILSPLTFFMIMVVTTGLREVAAMFANPFGTDTVDFPVNEWLSEMRGIVGLMVFRGKGGRRYTSHQPRDMMSHQPRELWRDTWRETEARSTSPTTPERATRFAA